MTRIATHSEINESLREGAEEHEQQNRAGDSAQTEAHEEHDPRLAHHYDSMPQQYEAVKFGMWLFLATEVLLFGGLFVLYAVYRGNNPELFQWGAQYLSTAMGATNTVVLILSSMTIAFAVRAAQLNHRRMLTAMLGLTVLGGAIFMGIKYVEYTDKFEKNLVWGMAFYEPPERDAALVEADEDAIVTETVAMGDPEVGRSLWMQTCLACHGDQGQGVRGQAFDVRDSEFVIESSDDDLLAFIKRGRQSFEPENRTGIQMPPRGGNPLLKDDQLRDIIAYMRTLEMPAASSSDQSAADASEKGAGEQESEHVLAAAGSDSSPHANTSAANSEFFIVKSSIPEAREGPAGLTEDWDRLRRRAAPEPTLKAEVLDPLQDPDRPANAHVFFGIYFLMTGLHGVHVMVGMVIIGVITFFAWRGAYSAAYFTPVEISGLYWHLVDVIWIFLFPLFYLIH